ncbi:carboxymuconolactone decarboxylase family protein [Cupriavidus sp. 2TAF22]|uniref:carboxymuconolactone decarboxylase family protein n=1 Tax=unclassified Cupriavidus TaxID=2640874 RepID=UPI003F911EF4
MKIVAAALNLSHRLSAERGGGPQLLAFYVNRAMNNGLTRAQASEGMTQLALYTAWSGDSSALRIVKDVFEKRPK